MSRLVRLVGAIAVLGVVAGSGWWLVGRGAAATPQAASTDPESATARQTAAVERRTLTVTQKEAATLGFAGTYDVIGGLSGTLTWTVPVGTVVTAGHRLYETNGKDRTSLMYGARPAWRPLGPGVSDGADVRQLEQNLKRLGYTGKATRSTVTGTTTRPQRSSAGNTKPACRSTAGSTSVKSSSCRRPCASRRSHRHSDRRSGRVAR